MAWNWRIRHKLMVGLGLVAAIMALLLAGTLKGLSSYRATMRTIDSKLAELSETDKLRAAIKVLADLPSNPAIHALELQDKCRQAREALGDYRAKLEDTIAAKRDVENGFNEMGQVKELEKRFDKLDRILRAMDPTVSGPGEGSVNILREGSPARLVVDDLIRTSADLNSVIYGDLHDRIKASKSDYKVSLAIVLTTSVLGVVLLAAFLRFFYAWIFYPIRDLEQGVSRVARGDFEHRIQVKSGDEIEDLAKAYNDMTERLRDMYRDLARQVNERSRQMVRSERLASVGFLAAGVAHEINNPLASIAFCSEALESRLADLFKQRASSPAPEDRETIAKYLKMIQEEAFRCKEITQRLLAFSRGGERRREPTNLAELIQGVLDMVQHLQNGKGKQLTFEPAENITAWVNGQEIKSVILNLVVNALDSMDEGGNLEIRLTQREDMAVMTFQDSGCGMTQEVLENIFEPFFTRSRTGKGTGLGLSISHRIISGHGGDIEATSAGLNQGSLFTVRVPLQPPKELHEAPPEQESLDPETEFAKLQTAKSGRRAA